MSASLLRVENMSKRFGAVPALRGVTLEVGADELLVVLGPTGAGKTTLLRCIAGLEQPDDGRVMLAGRDITGDSPAARDTALVFQNFSLYPDWTVRRNLEFPLRAPARRADAAQIPGRIAAAARMLKIEHLLERKASRLSGGEMQRVAIGRAIVRRPRLFLMDEPLTNLDAKLRESLRVELALLRRELVTPMVYVTHDQAEALSMADRIVVLSQGRLLQTGTPREIYERPVSPEVARQLGQPAINVLAVARRGAMLVTADGTPVLPAGPAARERCRVGIRPEDIELNGGATAARVRVVEDMGPVKIALIEWAGVALHVLVSSAAAVRPGDEVFPHPRPEKAVYWPDEDSSV